MTEILRLSPAELIQFENEFELGSPFTAQQIGVLAKIGLFGKCTREGGKQLISAPTYLEARRVLVELIKKGSDEETS